MKSRRRRIFENTALALGLAFLAWAIFGRDAGPWYQGRRLNTWLEKDDLAERRRALQALGSPGIEHLLHLVQTTEGAWERIAREMLGKSLSRHLIVFSADYRRNLALHGFDALGPDARSAIPVLSNCLQRAENPIDMSLALKSIGKEAVPALIAGMSSTDFQVQYVSVEALGFVGPDAAPAVPAIIKILDDPHVIVRAGAARALGGIHSSLETVIPALIETLDDSNALVRNCALEGLGLLGPTASNAVPRLRELEKDRHPQVREHARDALEKILGTPTPGKAPDR